MSFIKPANEFLAQNAIKQNTLFTLLGESALNKALGNPPHFMQTASISIMRSANQSEPGVNFLIVESDPCSMLLMRQCVEKQFGERLVLSQVSCGNEALALLRQGRNQQRMQSDVILIDIKSISDIHPSLEQAIGRICRFAGSALVLAISDGGSVSSALEAMRAGAHDYLVKPINVKNFAVRISELGHRHGNARALTAIRVGGEANFEGFAGASQQMKIIYEQIERIASSSAPVFITGESGTGKQVCAKALHRRSPRADKPFIAVNCAAVPRHMMEREIFGVAMGAYEGDNSERAGAAELAQGGVLFLDEIGEMDLGVQAKLLRFLQTGSVTRVGQTAPRQVDVRVICATSTNPMQLIAEKKFREDLFYRLHVLPIHLPPLRQRPADILPLAQNFLKRYSAQENKSFTGFSTQSADLVVSREWPGNVRQLQNLIRRIVIMFEGDQVSAKMVGAADIEAREGRLSKDSNAQPHKSRAHGIEPMWRQEQQIIEGALAVYDGNISRAAAALEISPSTIYRKRQAWQDKRQA
ncbi:Response regulator of zinc sigma-54-dependent two-component system [hydrothermal vent metagenome]|uniref:Response regulator of zinc sigma-54-dependent two-component system n=1 Tax=hydrothermal vent metagenome TaxID=652676 RepID=A0A3B0TKS5_9ZZZZ